MMVLTLSTYVVISISALSEERKKRKKKKKEDTHASSIILQVAEQYDPVDAGPAGLNWPYATTQKSPGLTRRYTLLPLYLAVCTTRLPVRQGYKNRL